MTPEIKLIHQLSHNAIFEVSSKAETDLKAWVANGQYLMDQALVPNAQGRASEFKLRFQDADKINIALANDCNRFSQAAIESMWCIGKVEKLPKSTAWATVQMYYSAFFAVHALLRIFGRACTQLDSSHVEAVYQVASATNMDSGTSCIENGFYISVIKNNGIEYKKLKDSHADTWLSFSNLLTWIINNIESTTGLGKHKSDAIDLVSNLKQAMSQSGAAKGNWPSQVRNRVNYQHSHGVWYPYKNALHDHEAILRNSEWLKQPQTFDLNPNTGEIQSLFNISNSILSLMYQLMKYGYDRAGKISLPLANGTFRLINQIRAA
ncbi:hypothetical protein [Oceanimonas smirnovii]|uniref:hypothetical protein n=1 Tax=Oceanimonas smirnovii TaxID=264574 RepID=UPI00037F00C0|nr:hypothetical protein [Oceanimonas smirnovii]